MKKIRRYQGKQIEPEDDVIVVLSLYVYKPAVCFFREELKSFLENQDGENVYLPLLDVWIDRISIQELFGFKVFKVFHKGQNYTLSRISENLIDIGFDPEFPNLGFSEEKDETFESVCLAALADDNQVRRAAENVLLTLQVENPSLYMMLMTLVLTQSADPNVRAFCTVMIRHARKQAISNGE